MCALNGIGIRLPDVLRCLLTIFDFCTQLLVQRFFIYGQLTVLLGHIVSALQVIELIHLLNKSFLLQNLAVYSHVLDVGNDVCLFRLHRKLVIDELFGCLQLCDFRIKLRIICCFICLKNAV